ncbi:MAG: polysaccharide pyruvyl transferase family protein [Luteimonas sp.]|nr:polysaccharide pyruvyl transferase family protein [Luteimonas sp.]
MQILLRDAVQSHSAAKAKGSLWNTGNYFFLDAVERQLSFDRVVYSTADLPDADTLVLSMSNFISPTTDLSHFADAIERKKYEKVVMIGAGAQAERFEDGIRLTPGTLRFLRILSERSASIGVRGFYTADILGDLGIHNTWVIGCPTLFWRMNAGFRIEKKRLPPTQPNFSVNSTPNGKYRDKLAMLYSAALDAGAQYIGQTENFLPLFGDDAEQSRDFFSHYYWDGSFEPSQLETMARLAIHFTSIPEWIDYMHRFDFVVGSRFHGNMAALQAGVPALTLLTDSRTKELCDFLNLPSLNLAHCVRMDFRELYERTDFDLFNATFATKYANYLDFLRHNGLDHRMPGQDQPSPRRPTVSAGGGKQANYDLSALTCLLQDARDSGFANDGLLGRQVAGLLQELRTDAVGNAAERGDFTMQHIETSGRDSRCLEMLLSKLEENARATGHEAQGKARSPTNRSEPSGHGRLIA